MVAEQIDESIGERLFGTNDRQVDLLALFRPVTTREAQS